MWMLGAFNLNQLLSQGTLTISGLPTPPSRFGHVDGMAGITLSLITNEDSYLQPERNAVTAYLGQWLFAALNRSVSDASDQAPIAAPATTPPPATATADFSSPPPTARPLPDPRLP